MLRLVFSTPKWVITNRRLCYKLSTEESCIRRTAMRSLFLINGLMLTAALHAQAQPADPFATVAAQQAFVTKTCAGCHNDKLKTGGFTWSKIDLNHPEQSAELSEKVVHIRRTRAMPP